MISFVAVDDTAPPPYRDGFVDAYAKVFAGAPYYESYTPEQVLGEVWGPHVQDGIVILALDSEQVVGFGCALPVLKAPADVQGFIVKQHGEGTLKGPLDTMWYMSELGVVDSHRRQGLAYQLVKYRLVEITNRGDSSYVFRTAAAGSNSRHLYERIGAQKVAIQDVSLTSQVVTNQSQSTQRVYLGGECASALSVISALGH